MAFSNRGPADKAYTTKQWAANRQHWRTVRRPCARCGKAIAYDAPYHITVRGKRTINPDALVVGHIVSKRRARRMGWTEAKTNALDNTQPECGACSVKSGAREGRKAQGQAKAYVIRNM